jgi:hypothetical protein
MQKIRIIGFFCENRPRWQLEVEKNLQMAVLDHNFIYLYIKRSYIIPYMYLTTGENLSQKRYNKIKVRKRLPEGQADPDNERPNKWSSSVQ